ncbi:nitroreductase family protein [Pseudomonas syringae]|uniref:nitroreductase family protein n=1 Tax=Pseudomonas syringae TaxID=317 RepID=UPI00020984BD|nr:nitroreductase family protein [Pseudomonas syringae]EGH71494.1 nitroreductase [Pseudomonas syringae pv. aceris str. M302273]
MDRMSSPTLPMSLASQGVPEGSFIDCGMFRQSVMIPARGKGLDTCPQAGFLQYQTVIARELGLSPEQILVCGMSLGYADESRPENCLVTEREDVTAFATFHADK